MTEVGDPVTRFVRAAESSFAFLAEWGFQPLPTVTEEGDPRDAATNVGFGREQRVVAVRLSHIVLDLSLVLGDTPSVGEGNSWPSELRHVVDFDEYLLAFHRSNLAPPFPEMGKDVVFSSLASHHPMKYLRVILPRLEQAVSVLAERFARFGRELIETDLIAVRSQIGRPVLE